MYGCGEPVCSGVGTTGWPVTFSQLSSSGVARDGDHVADLRAVVHRYNPVILDESRAREAALFRVGVDGVRKVAPVD